MTSGGLHDDIWPGLRAAGSVSAAAAAPGTSRVAAARIWPAAPVLRSAPGRAGRHGSRTVLLRRHGSRSGSPGPSGTRCSGTAPAAHVQCGRRIHPGTGRVRRKPGRPIASPRPGGLGGAASGPGEREIRHMTARGPRHVANGGWTSGTRATLSGDGPTATARRKTGGAASAPTGRTLAPGDGARYRAAPRYGGCCRSAKRGYIE
jgi:hypothetical protein